MIEKLWNIHEILAMSNIRDGCFSLESHLLNFWLSLYVSLSFISLRSLTLEWFAFKHMRGFMERPTWEHLEVLTHCTATIWFQGAFQHRDPRVTKITTRRTSFVTAVCSLINLQVKILAWFILPSIIGGQIIVNATSADSDSLPLSQWSYH